MFLDLRVLPGFMALITRGCAKLAVENWYSTDLIRLSAAVRPRSSLMSLRLPDGDGESFVLALMLDHIEAF
jgi:hypothetical protein